MRNSYSLTRHKNFFKRFPPKFTIRNKKLCYVNRITMLFPYFSTEYILFLFMKSPHLKDEDLSFGYKNNEKIIAVPMINGTKLVYLILDV